MDVNVDGMIEFFEFARACEKILGDTSPGLRLPNKHQSQPVAAAPKTQQNEPPKTHEIQVSDNDSLLERDDIDNDLQLLGKQGSSSLVMPEDQEYLESSFDNERNYQPYNGMAGYEAHNSNNAQNNGNREFKTDFLQPSARNATQDTEYSIDGMPVTKINIEGYDKPHLMSADGKIYDM